MTGGRPQCLVTWARVKAATSWALLPKSFSAITCRGARCTASRRTHSRGKIHVSNKPLGLPKPGRRRCRPPCCHGSSAEA